LEIGEQMRIIGITGRAGAGKDTVADYLVTKHGYTKVSFASILKNMLATCGLPEPQNRGDKEKNYEGFEFSFRDAAQKLGTEWGRSLDQDIWVKLTMNGLEQDKKFVFSDVRFENEATAIRDKGLLVHLRGRQVDLGGLSTHASEAGVASQGRDWIITNTGSMEDLYSVVDRMLDV
jgi:hypothetical protein